MGSYNRFTPEEDYLILREYWDPDRRQTVFEMMADRHTEKSVQFRYFQLLKTLSLGGASAYKRMMEAHEKDGLQLPVDLEELVRKLHSGELKAENKRKKKEEEIQEEPEEEKAFKPAPLPKEQAPPVVEHKEEEEEFVDPLAPVLGEIKTEIQGLNDKIEKVASASAEKALSDLFTFMANAARHKEQISNLETILEENKRLKEENEKLKEKYREKVKEFDDIYQRLDEVWGHFMRLTSVKKAMSLEDFINQLSFVIDKFGNVVEVTTREAGVRAAMRRAGETAMR